MRPGGVGFLAPPPGGGPPPPPGAGETITLHTYLAVRENALDLYGFLSEEELTMFTLLITLPGIGPRSALIILSQADVPLLRQAALGGDPAYLSKISGIGKKSAEKIVLGLREKLGAADLPAEEHPQAEYDAIDALIALGYSAREAREALQRVPPEHTDANSRIKGALKLLGK